MSVYKLWQQDCLMVRSINNSVRDWQVKPPVNKPVIGAGTIPVVGQNPVLGRPPLSDRNLRRITAKSKPDSPIHFGSLEGLEPDDARKAKNAAKRVRREMRA